MASILKVENIAHTNDTAAVTIASTGAVTFAKPQPPLVGSPVALSGLGLKTFTGIPAGTNRFTVVLDDVSGASDGGYLKLQLGTSSGLVTSGIYLTHNSNGTSTNSFAGFGVTNATEFRLSSWTNTATTMCGTVTFTHLGGNKWMQSSALVARAYPTYFIGFTGQVNLSAECTQVKVFLATGNFDGGSVNLLLG